MKAGFKSQVNKWEVFEVAVQGPSSGNPFVEQRIDGIFAGRRESKIVSGFYDGNGVYRVRFMPGYTGRYSFVVKGSFLESPVSGSFEVLDAREGNHGPVRVQGKHFVHADGTPHYSIGTTAYVWNLQDDRLIEETLESLRHSHFNKIRFCVFPKHYDFNLGEPRSYPYVGTPMDSTVLTSDNFMEYTFKTEGNHFDMAMFNPVHFQNIDKCVDALEKMNIQADLILFHPYDRWGFSSLTKDQSDLYLSYMVSRYSAYANVWWALANEYDLFDLDEKAKKSIEEWDRMGSLVKKKDIYGHPRSIHNCRTMYDHSKPWITHCSVQRIDLYKGAELTNELIEKYGKPVVMDELAYEGNIQHGWGNITGEEMVRRFWETAVRGGYPGHGETFMSDDGVLWWSHGGKLKGEAWRRFGLLKSVLEEVPGNGLACIDMHWDCVTGVPENEVGDDVKSMYLFYYSFMRPSFRDFHIDDDTYFKVDVIDTWEMTIEDKGIFKGKFRISLPGRQYVAVRLRKASEEDIRLDVEQEEFVQNVDASEPEMGKEDIDYSEVARLGQDSEGIDNLLAQVTDTFNADQKSSEASSDDANAKENERFEAYEDAQLLNAPVRHAKEIEDTVVIKTQEETRAPYEYVPAHMATRKERVADNPVSAAAREAESKRSSTVARETENKRSNTKRLYNTDQISFAEINGFDDLKQEVSQGYLNRLNPNDVGRSLFAPPSDDDDISDDVTQEIRPWEYRRKR